MKDVSEFDSVVEHPSTEIDKAEPDSYSASLNQSTNSGSNPVLIGLVLVVVFAIGLALGFFGRPQIMADVPVQVVVTVIPNENSQAASQTTNSTGDVSKSNDETTSQANASSAETTTGNSSEVSENETSDEGVEAPPTPTIMEFLLADARHFQGDDAAPVTIIEFSDFK